MEEFHAFRIVGGTSLSLQLGHRLSVDIDLFTDATYGTVDFIILEEALKNTFSYVDISATGLVGMGKSYFIGNHKDDLVKLDLFYTDPFVFPLINEGKIRFASVPEIAAMKFDVISRGGRKKDFWDVHELLEYYSLKEMLDFYQSRNPYGATKAELLQKLVDFSTAEGDFTPNCFKDKDWEIIKLDFIDVVNNNTNLP